MAPCKELTKAEFTKDRFLDLARDVERRQKWPKPFAPDHFFPTVHALMDQGLLKIWGCESAVLGGLFVRNLYSADPESLILFWWSRQGFNAEALRVAFEKESERQDVTRISTSVCGLVRSSATERLYRMKGYQPSEIIFGKFRR